MYQYLVLLLVLVLRCDCEVIFLINIFYRAMDIGWKSWNDLLAYFDATYVRGVTRAVRRPSLGRHVVTRFRRIPPLFDPSLWNVHEATLADQESTNNVCEGWNHAFAGLVGHPHPSIWALIEAIQMDEAAVSMDLVKLARGQPPVKGVKRSTEQHQRRLQQLCADRRANSKSVPEVLRALGHCVRVHV